MNRRRILWAVPLLCVVCLLAGSCSWNRSERAPTDSLTVYLPPDHVIEYALEEALRQFRAAYPEVEINLRKWESSAGYLEKEERRSDYRQTLQADLNAGKGPDLVLFRYDDFPDFEKVLRAGVFCDLDPFLNDDAFFDPANYQEAALQSGYQDEKRLYFPLTYEHIGLLTTQEALDAFDLRWTDGTSFEDWAAELAALEDRPEKPGTTYLLPATPEPYSRMFFQFSGLRLLDDRTRTFDIRSPAFKSCMDLYRATYTAHRESRSTPYATFGEVEDALAEERLVYYSFNLLSPELYDFGGHVRQATGKTVIARSFPAIEGVDPFVMVRNFAAIRSSSPNQANAFALLKLLLSKASQTKTMASVHPVLNAAMLQGLEKNMDWDAWPDTNAQEQAAYLLGLDCRRQNAAALTDVVFTSMTPWFEGRKSYEACLEELDSRLWIYLNE